MGLSGLYRNRIEVRLTLNLLAYDSNNRWWLNYLGVICELRGEDVLGFTEGDIGGDGVNTITLSCLFFNCLAFSALSDMSAIMPIVTNAEKINAIIDGITIITNFPEFIFV